MIKVIEAPLEQNLKALSVYWWQQNLAHKIVEEAGAQVVLLEAERFAEQMKEDYRAFSCGELKIEIVKQEGPNKIDASLSFIASLIQKTPVTLLLILLSVIGFLLVEFDQSTLVNLLHIQAMDNSNLSRQLNLSRRISPEEFLFHGHYWRLVTPIFLHFGWVHITFNMLWLWELGRRIEIQGGKIHFASVVFFIAVASNLYQAASTPYASFGGMSGVVYGLLGYCGVFHFIVPQKSLHLPKEVYILMLASLLIGWLGIFDFLARMANTAHFSGLLWGGFIAIPTALLTRYYQSRDRPS